MELRNRSQNYETEIRNCEMNSGNHERVAVLICLYCICLFLSSLHTLLVSRILQRLH